MPNLGTLHIALDGHAISESTVLMLAILLYRLQPKCIIESGTYMGTFAITAARASTDAHVYTADPVNHNWQNLLAANGVEDRVHYVQGDFAALADAHPEAIGNADLAFVDSGWPIVAVEPTMRLRHFRLAQRWVRRGGLVLIDDMAEPSWAGAQEIADECCIILPTDRGVGVWRKHQ